MKTLRDCLKGVRVLDLSPYISGPLASLMFVDMGAEVIKVEPPSGDPMRALGPRDRDGGALFYKTLSAGKTVVSLDLKDPGGLSRCMELIRECDILIEGFRPGALKRLGLDYAVLQPLNPGLIYCSINGYGSSGPDAQRAGHDANYLAECGVLDRNGDHRPAFFDPPIADLTGSLFAAMAILGALNGRHRTGLGCEIELALADAIMPLQMFHIADYGENGSVPKRRETYLNGGAAYYNIYETRDGRYVVVGAVEPKFWHAFSIAAGRPEWIARHGEPLPQRALEHDVADQIRKFTFAECRERFAADECCVSPVLSIDQAVASERVAKRGLVRHVPGGGMQSLFPAMVNGVPPEPRTVAKQITEQN